MSLLKDFEALCKYVRECTGDDIVCGLCEYDAGTVGEEQIECPGFESNECFVLKESLKKQYEMYKQVIRCKECRFWQDNNGGYPNENCKWRADETPDADDWCSGAERKTE